MLEPVERALLLEVLVGGMLICAREQLYFAQAVDALRLLAAEHPSLLKRIGMANGTKYLMPEETVADGAPADGDEEGKGEGGGGEGEGDAEPAENGATGGA